MNRGARAAALIAAAAAMLAGSAVAAAPSRVVLLRVPGADTLTRQAETLLGAELRAAGFEVVERARTPDQELRAELESTAAAGLPIASLAIFRLADGPAVELWLSDRLTRKLVIRRVDTSASSDAADLALKAVELLRGSLMEIASESPRPPPPAAGPAAPADVTRFVARGTTPPQTFLQGFGVGVGGAVQGTFSDVGPSVAPVLRVSYGAGRLGVRLSLLGPASASDVESRDAGNLLGRAQVRQEMALLEGLYGFRPGSAWQPFVAAGAGAHHTRVQGTGGAPLFTGQSNAAFGLLVSAGAGVAFRLGTRAALTVEADGTVVMPGARVMIAGQPAARVGGPAALLSAGVLTTF